MTSVPNLMVSVDGTESDAADVSLSYKEEPTEKLSKEDNAKPVHVTLTVDDELLDYEASPSRSSESVDSDVDSRKVGDLESSFEIPLAKRCESDETKALSRDDLDLAETSNYTPKARESEGSLLTADIENLYDEFEIDIALLCGTDNDSACKWRLDTVHLKGVSNLSTDVLLDYFVEFSPVGVDWVNNNSCNVRFNDKAAAARAMLAVSMQLKRTKQGLPYTSTMQYSSGEDSDVDTEPRSGSEDLSDGEIAGPGSSDYVSPLKRMLRGVSPSAVSSDGEVEAEANGHDGNVEMEEPPLEDIVVDTLANVCYVDVSRVREVPKRGIWRICRDFTSDGLVCLRFGRKADNVAHSGRLAEMSGQAESVSPRKRVLPVGDFYDEYEYGPSAKKIYTDLRYKLDEDNGSDRETVSEISEDSNEDSSSDSDQEGQGKKKKIKMRMRADREEEKQRSWRKQKVAKRRSDHSHSDIPDLRVHISRDRRMEAKGRYYDHDRFSDLDEDEAVVFVE